MTLLIKKEYFMKIRKHFTVKNVFFTILLLFVLYFISQTKEIALLFFGGFVIACSLEPLVDKLSQKINRSFATGIVLTVATIAVLLFFLPVIILAAKEAGSMINVLPEQYTNLRNFLSATEIAGVKLLTVFNIDQWRTGTSGLAQNILSGSINFTMNLIEGVAVAFSVLMVVFYLLIDKDGLKNGLIRFFPTYIQPKAKIIYESIEQKVGGYVIAQGCSMGVVGILTAIGLLILNVKYAIVLGLISGILDIVPIIGPIIAFVLGAVVGLEHGWLYIIPVAIVYVVAQWVSNQIVRPLVFGKFMDMHPLVIIFAFLIAAKFLGVWGVILAPAIASMFKVLIDELYLDTLHNKSDEIIE